MTKSDLEQKNTSDTSEPIRKFHSHSRSSSHWYSNLFHSSSHSTSKSDSTSSSSNLNSDPNPTSLIQETLSDFQNPLSSTTSSSKDSSSSKPKHKRSASSWRNINPFSSRSKSTTPTSDQNSSSESSASLTSPPASTISPQTSITTLSPNAHRRTSTNLSYSSSTIGATPSSSKRLPERSPSTSSGVSEEETEKLKRSGSHRHSVIGFAKSLGHGLHSLPSRYSHSRNASETFKQMRAKEGEEGKEETAGAVVESSASREVSGGEDAKKTENSGQVGKEKLDEKEMKDQKEGEESSLKPQDSQMESSHPATSEPLSPPQMDSSASLRTVPSSFPSESRSVIASSKPELVSKNFSSLEDVERVGGGPTVTIRAAEKVKEEVEILKSYAFGTASTSSAAVSTSNDQAVEKAQDSEPMPSQSLAPPRPQSSQEESFPTKSDGQEDTASPSPIEVPQTLGAGEVMLKVTPKKVMKRVFRIDADRGQILWDSKKKNKVDLESIREVRVGSSASSYRISLSISAAHESRWLSIIYQTAGQYKALHLIAMTDESLVKWRDTLCALQGLRRSLMGGLGLIEQRQDVWLRQHWREADASGDEKLDFLEISQLCKRLGIESSRKELKNRFEEADEKKRGFLDFKDFQRFVKLLKRREEVEEIFETVSDVWVEVAKGLNEVGSLTGLEKDIKVEKKADEVVESSPDDSGHQAAARSSSPPPPTSSIRVRGITVSRFKRFLHDEQMMSSLNSTEVFKVFEKHQTTSSSILSVLPGSPKDAGEDIKRPLPESALLLEGFSAFLMSADNSILLDRCPLISCPQKGRDSTAPSPQAPGSTLCLRDGLISSGKLQESAITLKTSNAALPKSKSRAAAETTEELLAASTPRQAPIHHDMTRPLSDYFISSSHNTYLVGGQWKGDSTVEGYVRALQQGARSVELDCWDGPNLVPQITHGRTLTSKVPFSDVIAAIANYAFVASPYPLILSLEVHNDVPQQDVMAKILREKLGEMLLTEKLDKFGELKDGESIVETLPSPERLRGKVLIKTKNLYVAEEEKKKAEKAEIDAEQAIVAEGQTTSTDTTESDGDGLFANARDLVRQVTKRSNHSSTPSKDSTSKSSNSSSKVLMSSSLASLLVYTVGVKHRGLNKKESYAVEHMISLSEKSAFKYVRDKNASEDLIKHNRSHLTRVYPSMSSIARLHASANFNPHHMWATGCQLVALNWQTLDLGFEINQALFARNGRCGYVLKPEALRSKELGKNSGEKIRLAIDVTVISAQQLPRLKDLSKDKEEESDAIDPFVAVSIQTPEGWGAQPTSGEGPSSQFGSRDSLLGSGGLNTPVVGTPPGRVSAQTSPSTRHLRLPSGGSGPGLGLGKSSTSSSAPAGLGLLPSNSSPSTSSSTPVSISQSSKPTPNSVLATPPPRSPSPSPALGSSPPTSFPPSQSLKHNFSSSSLSSTSSRSSVQLNQRTSKLRTRAIRGNGFNPIWKHKMTIYLDVPAGEKTLSHLAEVEKERTRAKERRDIDGNGDEDDESQQINSNAYKSEQIHSLCRGLLDLCFLRFEVAEDEASKFEKETSNNGSINVASSNNSSSSSANSSEGNCIATCTLCLGSMQQGYRHVPLYDSQLSQYLFSTLFVHTKIRFVGLSGGSDSSSRK